MIETKGLYFTPKQAWGQQDNKTTHPTNKTNWQIKYALIQWDID
jgi:hypothetical protein